MKSYLIITVFFVKLAWTQNLLENGGFELYNALPTNVMQSDLCVGWSKCNLGGGGSPDYFHVNGTGLVQLPNSFYATVQAHGGSAIMGLITYHGLSTNFREYLSHALVSPLVVGATYNVQFFLSNGMYNGNYGGCGSNHFGMAFSTIQCQQNGTSPMDFMIPQYSENAIFYHNDWQQVNFSFVADSAYQYLTIGNFTSNANTLFQNVENSPTDIAYFFVDDIQVVRVEESTNVESLEKSKVTFLFYLDQNELTCFGIEGADNELIISDGLGRCVFEKKHLSNGKIDLSNFPSQRYFYRYANENNLIEVGSFFKP